MIFVISTSNMRESLFPVGHRMYIIFVRTHLCVHVRLICNSYRKHLYNTTESGGSSGGGGKNSKHIKVSLTFYSFNSIITVKLVTLWLNRLMNDSHRNCIGVSHSSTCVCVCVYVYGRKNWIERKKAFNKTKPN